MRWSIEIGRINFLTELNFLSKNLCSLIKVHLDAVYNIFRYFQNNLGVNPGRMTYDSMYEPTYDNLFDIIGRYLDKWKDFYPDAQ